MRTSPFIKMLGLGLSLVANGAFATGSVIEAAAPKATCNCRNAGDCTCPKGQCKCSKCGKSGARPKMFESLKGNTETSTLPKTARAEARGGIFI